MSPVVVQCVVRVEPASAGGAVAVIGTFGEIEHPGELKAVAQGAVEAGAKNAGSAATLAELRGSGAVHRAIAAALNAESVAGKCAAVGGRGTLFREAVGAEEVLPRGEAGAPGESTLGQDVAVVVTRVGAMALATRAGGAVEYAAGALLPDGRRMRHQRRVVLPVQLITVVRN